MRERAEHPRRHSADAPAQQPGLPAATLSVAADVYAGRGLAFAEEGRVQILELFHSASLDSYRDRIHVDRGAFIR